jgi:hypothetical protein
VDGSGIFGGILPTRCDSAAEKGRSSVATVVTDAFRKKFNYEPRKLDKTVRIFVEIEYIKNQGSHFGPRE